MHLFWEGLLTQLPSALITATVVGVTTCVIRGRARRRRSPESGED